MDRTVVTVSSPADILGILPHRLGFHPSESLVSIALAGPRRRDRLVMRIDLPDPGHDLEVAREIGDRLRRSGADAAFLVCYSDAPAPAHGLLRAPLLRTVRAELRRRGIDVVDSLLVRDGRWWSYICVDEVCCPSTGTPLPESPTPAASFYAAEAVGQGAVVLADRQALEASIEPDPGAPALAEEARRWAEGRLGLALADGVAGLRAQVGEEVDELARSWADGDCTIEDRSLATVLLGLQSRDVRDSVMTRVLDHDPRVLATLFTAIARRTPDAEGAPVCTVLAWFAFAAGNGALAVMAAQRALRAEPGYAMAELILAGVDAMQPPSVVTSISRQVRADLDDLDSLGGLDDLGGLGEVS